MLRRRFLPFLPLCSLADLCTLLLVHSQSAEVSAPDICSKADLR